MVFSCDSQSVEVSGICGRKNHHKILLKIPTENPSENKESVSINGSLPLIILTENLAQNPY